MKSYTLYNRETGTIIGSGACSEEKDLILQKQNLDQAIVEGFADGATQKVIDGKIVSKTQAEIEAEKPKEISFEEQIIYITNQQWQGILDRISALESEV